MFKRIRGERGFTLIELLVVLAIMAILVALVVPDLARVLARAEETAKNQEKDAVQTAIDVYNTQDVAVEGAKTIGARAEGDAAVIKSADADAAVITSADTDVPFAKYLRGTTKYKYYWDENGDNLKVLP